MCDKRGVKYSVLAISLGLFSLFGSAEKEERMRDKIRAIFSHKSPEKIAKDVKKKKLEALENAKQERIKRLEELDILKKLEDQIKFEEKKRDRLEGRKYKAERLKLRLERLNDQLGEVKKGVSKAYKPAGKVAAKVKKKTEGFKKVGDKLSGIRKKIGDLRKVREKPVGRKLLEKEHEKIIEELKLPSVSREYKPMAKEKVVEETVSEEISRLNTELEEINRKIAGLGEK